MVRAPDYDDKTEEAPVPPPYTSGTAPILEPNEARGGVTHHNVRVVLAVGLAGAVAVLVIAYIAFFGGRGAGPI